MFDCEDGRDGGVVEVDERHEAFAVANDRHEPFAHGLEELVAGVAVEAAVAERDPAGGGNHPVEVGHRGERRLGPPGRDWDERVVLRLDHPTLHGVAVGGEALGDEPLHARLARRVEEGVGALGPEPVGLGEGFIELPGKAATGKRRRLVDDHLRPGVEHGFAHGCGIEQVERDRLGPKGLHVLRPLRR